jgi:hypothetical protein
MFAFSKNSKDTGNTSTGSVPYRTVFGLLTYGISMYRYVCWQGSKVQVYSTVSEHLSCIIFYFAVLAE